MKSLILFFLFLHIAHIITTMIYALLQIKNVPLSMYSTSVVVFFSLGISVHFSFLAIEHIMPKEDWSENFSLTFNTPGIRKLII